MLAKIGRTLYGEGYASKLRIGVGFIIGFTINWETPRMRKGSSLAVEGAMREDTWTF